MGRAGMCTASFISICCLRESLDHEHRAQVQWSSANPFAPLCFLLSSRFLMFFGIMALLDVFAGAISFSMFLQYAAIVFQVDFSVLAPFFSLTLFLNALVLLCALGPMVAKLGEVSVLKIG